jgi:GNAT superfamily N-acetyltransferase
MKCSRCGRDLRDCDSCRAVIGLMCGECVPRGESIDFQIRRAADSEDEQFVLGFLEDLFGETEFIEFEGWYRAGDMEKLLAEGEDGERVGFALYCYEEDGTLMTLLTVNVHEKFMRRGVATALLREIVSIASQSGVERIRVPISNDDLLSYVFYHRRGFRLSGLDVELCLRRHGREEEGFWQLPLRDEFYLFRDLNRTK